MANRTPIASIAAKVPNAMAIGPFGSDLVVSDYTDSGVPIVFVRNVRPNSIDMTRCRFVSDEKAAQLSAHIARPGDLIVTKMGLPPCVAAVYPPKAEPAVVTADIIKVTLDLSAADPSYVAHYLNSPGAKADVERFTFGQTRPKVTLTDFKGLEIPLPPLPEQRRIAAILDKADAIRRKRQEAIALTDKLLRSAFHCVFGDIWDGRFQLAPIATLGAVKVGRMRTPAHQTGKFTKSYLRVANVHMDELRLDDVLSMDFTPDECETFRLEYGDVLLNEGQSTELVGRPAMWRDELPECYFQNSLIRFRADLNVMVPEYALDVFLDLLRRGVFAANSAKTSNMAHLGGSRFAAIPVPVPPVALQQRWVVVRESVRAIRLRLQGAGEADEALALALSHEAFSGEL